jgi:hypothetical protein
MGWLTSWMVVGKDYRCMWKGLSAHEKRTRNFIGGVMRKKRAQKGRIFEAILSDEEIRSRLKLTASDLDVLQRAIHEVGAERNIGSRLLALKMKIAATVEPPTQRVAGDVSVQVVVNTMKRPEYALPAETTTSSLPEKADGTR